METSLWCQAALGGIRAPVKIFYCSPNEVDRRKSPSALPTAGAENIITDGTIVATMRLVEQRQVVDLRRAGVLH